MPSSQRLGQEEGLGADGGVANPESLELATAGLSPTAVKIS